MTTVCSPKDLATAIGVSESSVKRWVDDGTIDASRTAGGHRRIPLSEAIRFIRQRRTPVVRPDLLGLRDLATLQKDGDATGGDSSEQFFDYLREIVKLIANDMVMSGHQYDYTYSSTHFPKMKELALDVLVGKTVFDMLCYFEKNVHLS